MWIGFYILILSFRQAEEPPQVTQDLSLASSSQNSLKHTVPESTPNQHPPDAATATKTCIYLYLLLVPTNGIYSCDGTRNPSSHKVQFCTWTRAYIQLCGCVSAHMFLYMPYMHTFESAYMCNCAFAYAYTCIWTYIACAQLHPSQKNPSYNQTYLGNVCRSTMKATSEWIFYHLDCHALMNWLKHMCDDR